MRTQIGKWGNSLAVRIPGPYAKDLCLKEGMTLDAALVAGSHFLRRRDGPYTRDEIVAGITPENRYGETDWGEAAGKEVW